MRCSLVAEKKNFLQNFTNKVFDAIWKDGLNLNDKLILQLILEDMHQHIKTSTICIIHLINLLIV